MKILHTSDWHLGKSLSRKDRTEDFQRMIRWFLDVVEEEQPDVILISGDIFDTTMPGPEAWRLYFDFLNQVAHTRRSVVITAGNHDSVSILKAPADLLSKMNIHVRASAVEDVLIPFDDITVVAMPYIRVRDLNFSLDSDEQMSKAVMDHYARVADQAMKRQNPLVAMGHLSMFGATYWGDGVRAIRCGFGDADLDCFDFADYVALGHFHIHQKVGGIDRIRYSGSPMAFGFADANLDHGVLMVDTDDFSIRWIKAPVFRSMVLLKGTLDEIEKSMASVHEPSWFSVVVSGLDMTMDVFRHRLEQQMPEGSEILSISTERSASKNELVLASERPADLRSINPLDVFKAKLIEENIPSEEWNAYIVMHNEILEGVQR